MSRRRISTTQRLAIFKRHGGVCHLCGGKIAVAELWDISHDRPLEMGGEDGGDNLKPAHRTCHRAHTAKIDQPTIALAKSREAKHLGAVAPSSRPIRSAGFPRTSTKRRENPLRALAPKPLFVEETAR